jgi:hypothetical protein
LLEVLALFIGQGSPRAHRTARPFIGKTIQAMRLVRRPPAADGFRRNAEHLRNIALAEPPLAAVQGAQAQRLEDVIGQLASVRQFDGHDRYSFCGLAVPP